MNRFKNMMYSGVMLAQLNGATLPVQGNAITLSEIQGRIQQIAQFLIVISMVVAVIYIVYGGIRYMMAAGDPKAAEAAKAGIIHGIIGAAVILGVGVILQTVAGLVTRSFFGS